MNDRFHMKDRAARKLTPVYFNIYEVRKQVRKSDGAISYIHDCIETYKVKNLSFERIMLILGELHMKWKDMDGEGIKHRVFLEMNAGESHTPMEWRVVMR